MTKHEALKAYAESHPIRIPATVLVKRPRATAGIRWNKTPR